MNYRQQLSNFASEIHNIFGLQEQGRELMALVAKALNCRWACLLFIEIDGREFTTLSCQSGSTGDSLSVLRLDRENPVIEYISREKKLLTGENLALLPEFRRLWEQDTWGVKKDEIELFLPVVSRDRLMGIMMLSKKLSGNYEPEDLSLLQDVTEQIAVSMEKQYLLEQSTNQAEKLSVINRCSAIISSTMDIQSVFDNFVVEVEKILNIDWAAVVLLEDDEFYFMALSSEIDSIWGVGERVPSPGTAIGWLASHKKTVVESNLTQGSRFALAEGYLKQGLCSVAYMPLMAKNKVIGSLVVASQQPNTYSQSQIIFLEQLASQIAMPIENARLYAEVEEKARIDELTGLFNRRSLDEAIVSEINRHMRYGGVFSLIILDLDGFKAFNDNYGHLVGDKVLAEIGNIIKYAIRGADRAFRYGGDEFAIFLPNTPIGAAKIVAERVLTQIALRVIDDRIKVTASLGLASWPDSGKGMAEVVAAADAALYHAKRSGGNQTYSATV